MRKGALWVVLLASLCGCVLAGLSTWQHLRILRRGFEEQSFCAISEKVNCDVVNASSYSEFLGTPIAWWGLLFYLLIGAQALLGLNAERKDGVAFAWALSMGSLLYCAFLAYISAFVLKTFCIECLGMYGVSIAFAVGLYFALDVRPREVLSLYGDPVRRFMPHALAAAGLYAFGWGAMALAGTKVLPKQSLSLDEKLLVYNSQPKLSLEPDPTWPAWGDPKAKTTLVEFSEFKCPFCRISAFGVKPYLQEFHDRLRYYFVHYPLDTECNPHLKETMHPSACFASKASVCAQRRGDFWEFHDELFRNQDKLDKRYIADLAVARGWDLAEFLACVQSPEVAERLRRDIELGASLKIEGTPTLVLDGRVLRNWRDPKFVQEVVRRKTAE
ncbi:MAG: vitamin K epoxide reductase family protein [Elusimicrobiota bacterium]